MKPPADLFNERKERAINPRVLVLRCYTWTGTRYTNGLSYNINSDGELNALERLVDVVTQLGTDPATVKPQPWITSHLERTRQDAVQFYGRHTVAHPTVEAFQFFKNEKLLAARALYFNDPLRCSFKLVSRKESSGGSDAVA